MSFNVPDGEISIPELKLRSCSFPNVHMNLLESFEELWWLSSLLWESKVELDNL
jgi:hypothetical protein